MADRFAALVETPETQLLVYLEEETDETGKETVEMRHVAYIDDMRVTISLGFALGDDGEGWDKAEELLAEVDREYAERFLENVRREIRDMGVRSAPAAQQEGE